MLTWGAALSAAPVAGRGARQGSEPGQVGGEIGRVPGSVSDAGRPSVSGDLGHRPVAGDRCPVAGSGLRRERVVDERGRVA